MILFFTTYSIGDFHEKNNKSFCFPAIVRCLFRLSLHLPCFFGRNYVKIAANYDLIDASQEFLFHMNLSKLYARTKKAVEEYHMIEPGDRIAVGLSGGKDSLALLYALHGLSRFKDASFTLEAVMVDLGFDGFDPQPVQELCGRLSIPFTRIRTRLGEVIFEKRQESNPCSLCSRMRKGALNKAIVEMGCNKLAYGHHRDDFIETLFLSLLYEGRFHTMEPKFYMEQTGLTLIRPLLYVPEEDIQKFQETMNLPVIANPCPADGKTSRQDMTLLLDLLRQKFPDCREKLFAALKDINFFTPP